MPAAPPALLPTRQSLLGDLLLLAIPFLAGLFAVIGLGAHPHNDDFLYARSVKLWLETGEFHFTGLNALPTVSAVTLIVQGYLSSRIFGFSFEALRASNVLICYLGVMGAYFAARQLSCSRSVSTMLALGLAVGPFYFGNAFTFMTDAPAVAWGCMSLPIYLRGMRTNSIIWAFAASLVLTIGTWTRQTAAFVALIPATYAIMQLCGGQSLLRSTAFLFASVSFPFASFLLSWSGVYLPADFQRYPGVVNEWNVKFIKDAVFHLYAITVLVGFFQLPVAPLLFGRLCEQLRRLPSTSRAIVASVGLLSAIIILTAFFVRGGQWHITNSTGDFLQNAHFGPVFLCDRNERWGDIGGVVWPVGVWQVLTVASIASASILGTLMLSTLVASRPLAFLEHQIDKQVVSFHSQTSISSLFALAITMFVLLVAIAVRFDRYWMASLPFLLVVSASELGECKRPLRSGQVFTSSVLTLALFWISLAFSHDLAAFNQARWQLVQAWIANGDGPRDLDAGYDINGWHRSAEDPLTRPRPGDGLLQFWVGHAKRFIAVGPREGFEIHERQPWFSWATMSRHEVLGLRRVPSHNSSAKGIESR